MSVTSATEIDCSGSLDQMYQRTYTRRFRVECDNLNDGPVVIRAALNGSTPYVPALGTPYQKSASEREDFVVVTGHSYSIESKNAATITWAVDVSYGAYDASIFGPNPLDWPTIFWYDTVRFDRVIDQDINGNAIVNSAHERFEEPVTRDDTREILNFKRNELVANYDEFLAGTYRDTLNDAPWNIFPAGTVKCAAIVPGEPQRDTNAGVWYFTVQYSFEINPDGWAKSLLDQGLAVLDGSSPPKQKRLVGPDGQALSEAVPLDGSGARLATNGTPVYLSFNVYPTSDFSKFNLVLANCLGR